MALSLLTNWQAGDVLYAADLRGEFNNIYNNSGTLISPLTANLDLDGFDLLDIDEVELRNAAADATAVRRLRANAANLTWHDGTNVLTLSSVLLALTTGDITGLDELAFTDAAANASATRRLRANAANLTWHDGTAAGRMFYAGGTDVPVADGGTNSSTALNNSRMMVSSGGAIVEAGAMTNGQLLIGSTGAAPVVAALTAGTNMTVTNAAGAITLASTASAGALTRVGGNLTEATTTSTTVVDLISVTGLSITTTTPFFVVASYRKTSGAADTVNLGLTLNTTQVKAPGGASGAQNEAQSGFLIYFVGAHDATYLRSGFLLQLGGGATGGMADNTGHLRFADGNIPNATITDVVIRGQVSNAAITLAVDEVHVYTLATS